MRIDLRRVDWAAVAAVPVFAWLVIPTTIHAERIGLPDPWLVMLAVPVALVLLMAAVVLIRGPGHPKRAKRDGIRRADRTVCPTDAAGGRSRGLR